MEACGRKKTEVLVLAVIVIAAALISFVRISINNKSIKEQALVNELKALRASVELYVSMNKAFPKDLRTLYSERFVIAEKSKSYLSNLPVNRDGELTDSFGNQFKYEQSSGRIWSGTAGYERW